MLPVPPRPVVYALDLMCGVSRSDGLRPGDRGCEMLPAPPRPCEVMRSLDAGRFSDAIVLGRSLAIGPPAMNGGLQKRVGLLFEQKDGR